MNPRIAGIAAAALALLLLGFYFIIRPASTGDVTGADRSKPATVELHTQPAAPSPPPTKPAPPAPAVEPALGGGVPMMVPADAPDQEFDPMSSYPMTKQGFEGAFQEMQIEFDACRAERGVAVDPNIEVVLTVRRASPPHEEYGIEPGEIWGMVTQVEVVGQDVSTMKPFTDCVQDNLHDLLFDPPEQDVRVRLPITFK